MRSKFFEKLFHTGLMFSVFFVFTALILGGKPWVFPRGIYFALHELVKDQRGRASKVSPSFPSN